MIFRLPAKNLRFLLLLAAAVYTQSVTARFAKVQPQLNSKTSLAQLKYIQVPQDFELRFAHTVLAAIFPYSLMIPRLKGIVDKFFSIVQISSFG